VLKATQIGGRGRVLIAGVDEDRTRSVFGDVVKKVPTGEEGDACGGEGEFAPEKFEDSFVRMLDRTVAFGDVIRGASGKDFGIARVGDVVGVGAANVGDDETVFGDGGPEERGESLAGRIAAAVTRTIPRV